MADNYNCSLNDYYQKKAQEELNEDSKNRMAAVTTFRNWILTQEHIRCPTDTLFLLRFLRAAKFSQLLAREYLTNYLTVITRRPEYFCNIDMADAKIQSFLSSGYAIYPEHRGTKGRQYVIARAAALDPHFKTYDKEAVYKGFFGVMIYLQSMEENQVGGYSYFIDLTDFSIMHGKIWNLDDMKISGMLWDKCVPGRFKEFHHYNHGPIYQAAFDLFKPFMTKKLKERVKFHGKNMEEIYKVIPKECLPVEYLPDDYDGPNAGTIEQLIESLKSKVTEPEVRERIQYETDPRVCWIDLGATAGQEKPQTSFLRLNTD